MNLIKLNFLFLLMFSCFAFAEDSTEVSLSQFDSKKMGILKGYLDIEADQNPKGLKKLYLNLGLYHLSTLDASDFVRPNERNPKKSAFLLKEAPEGVYLSVGTERGFMGATLAPNTSHLLLVDMDPNVHIFNYLNILFLKLAKDRQDYKYLRFQAGHSEIVGRAEQMGFAAEDVAFLKNLDVFHFLKYLVRSSFFLRPVSIWAPFSAIAGRAHYMNNLENFNKLSALAKSGRIKTFIGDLGSEEDLKKIEGVVEKWNTKVSVLDISNAWVSTYINEKTNQVVPGYMSDSGLKFLIQKVSEISSSESILLVTQLDRRFGYLKQVWNYFGMKLHVANKYSNTEAWKILFPGQGKLGNWQKNSLVNFENSSKYTCKSYY